MALQHLRSGTANKRPLPTAMSDGQLAVNTNLASPGLFFKDGNGDLVKVGPVHIGTTAPNASPASTAATALVANTIYKILTVGTSDFTTVGASSNAVGVVFTASGTTTGTGTVSGEQGNEKGEQWLDTTGGTYVLKIYDGTAWRSESGTFVDASGDTMTGDLLFNNANIVFEGSSADDHETTLTVANPTADRTITLPNTTGTVVTTGDTGSITSTMITDGTIVNADVNASAAIAGTKISPDFGSQAITTTGIINANGKVSFPLGSATAPSLLPGSDTNTGIFSPGADQIAIATNGGQRVSIDASGQVLIGADTTLNAVAQRQLMLVTEGGGQLAFARNDSSTNAGNHIGELVFFGKGGGVYERCGRIAVEADLDHASNDKPSRMVFETTADGGSSPTPRMTIDSAGRVGIGGTPSAGTLLHVIGSSGAVQINNVGDTLTFTKTGDNTITAPSTNSNLKYIASSHYFSGGRVEVVGPADFYVSNGSNTADGVIIQQTTSAFYGDLIIDHSRLYTSATDGISSTTGIFVGGVKGITDSAIKTSLLSDGRIDAGALTIDSNLTPSAGTSVEHFYASTGGVIQSFDRDNGNLEPLRVRGSTWDLGLDGNATFKGATIDAGTTTASRLWIKNSGNAGSNSDAHLDFGAIQGDAGIAYSDTGNKIMTFKVDGYEIMRLQDFNTTAGGTNIEHRVGIGTSAPESMLDVEDGAQFVERSTIGSNDPRIKLEKVVTGSTITGKITTDNLVNHQAITWLKNDGVTTCGSIGNADYLYVTGAEADLAIKSEAGNITFVTSGGGGVEQMRIDSSGRVGIGASNNSSYDSIAQNLLVADESGNTGITIRSGGSTPFGAIHFADGTGSNAEKRAGRIIYQHAINTLSFSTADTEAMRIDSSGNVGIGATSLNNYSNYNTLTINGASGGVVDFKASNTDIGSIYSTSTLFQIQAQGTTIPITFRTNSNERMRINADGSTVFTGAVNLALIRVVANGTTYPRIIGTPDGTFYSESSAGTYPWQLNPNGAANFASTTTIGGGALNGVDAGVQLFPTGGIHATQASGSSTILSGYVEGSSTKNVAITAQGSADFVGNVQAAGTKIRLVTSSNHGLIRVLNSSLVDTIGLDGSDGSATFKGVQVGGDPFPGTAVGAALYQDGSIALSSASSTGTIFFGYTQGSSTTTTLIKANGTASFSGTVSAQGSVLTSDQRFKENITDANPQLADVTALGNKLRNWDWTADAPVADKDTRFLGLVAQEAETVCPGIVTTIARTKDGAELTPEVVVPAVYETRTVPAVLDEKGEVVEAETTEQVLVTKEQVTPATYEQLDDSYKGIKNDILIMKLLGAVAELSAKVAALEAG